MNWNSIKNNVSINDCPNLTPKDECSVSCCPDYIVDDDFSKAFNKITLDQQKEITRLMLDGIWYNIEDAKNTISQIEQYLACVYELLVASLDQFMKISSTAGRTEADYESAMILIDEYEKEIDKLISNANYNGRHLLRDTNDTNIYSLIFRLANHRGFVRNGSNNIMNDFTIDIPNVGLIALGLRELNESSDEDDEDDGADEGVVGPDSSDSDNVDESITLYNNAIKVVMNEFDKMKAYRFLLCGREKQVRIWKNGQDICFNHKCKI